MNNANVVEIDGRTMSIGDERNLFELIRKADVDLPTFCYHSELSVYGACRLCMVEVEGRGLVASCSLSPEPGMKVRTHTEELRELRRISIELLLANHEQACPTCVKSASCQLQALARRLGIQKVRFKSTTRPHAVDRSTPYLVREPHKCILCGDCVRMCSEVQSVGAIGFANRGAAVSVQPAFGKDLAEVACVGCGQCASVCPTGALAPRSEVEQIWGALGDKRKTVVAQIAPAVRVALGELFGLPAGANAIGQAVAALKRLGFAHVYDTAFGADLTVMEETHEFLKRKAANEPLPLFTSCCPAWVRFAEQYLPELVPNLSTCKSPQQMLGAVLKAQLPQSLGIARGDLVIVAIMPCTAKKGEAQLPKFREGNDADVDHVLTTVELAGMIEAAGLRWERLAPESLEMPFGSKSGAGLIFGSTGGVSEAVLRHAAHAQSKGAAAVATKSVRGEAGMRETEVHVGDATWRFAVVHGLAHARRLAERIRRREVHYDFVEVMACPGGCVNGAGNPVAKDKATRTLRTKGLYDADTMLEAHVADENQHLAACYRDLLEAPGSARAHALLHTHYQHRCRLQGETLALHQAPSGQGVSVNVCVGTGCHVRGAPELLRGLLRAVDAEGLTENVAVQASFCHENCDRGPVLTIGDQVITRCDLAKAKKAVFDAVRS